MAFDSGAGPDPVAIADLTDEAAAPPPRRLPLLAVAAVVAVAALAGGAVLLLGGSGEDAPAPAALTYRARPSGTPSANATPSAGPVRLPAVTDSPLGRDPFAALYVAPTAAPPEPLAPPAGPAEVTTGPGDPSYPGPAASTGPGPSDPAAARTTTLAVKAVRVAPGDAGAVDLVVDGAAATLHVGDTFPPSLRLVSVQETPVGRCATLQHGEELFDACEGDPPLVR